MLIALLTTTGLSSSAAAGLTREQLDAPPSDDARGMLKHLAYVEDGGVRFLGSIQPAMGYRYGRTTTTGTAQRRRRARALHARSRDACGRSRAVLDEHRDLHALAARDNRHGVRFSLRWILVHMIEEYARHAGHADLIRQAIDGATGD